MKQLFNYTLLRWKAFIFSFACYVPEGRDLRRSAHGFELCKLFGVITIWTIISTQLQVTRENKNTEGVENYTPKALWRVAQSKTEV